MNLQLWNGTAIVNDQNATLQGLDVNGDAISGATLSLAVNDAELINFDTSGIAQFNQISALLVTPSSSSNFMAYGFIDDIAVSNVIPEPSTTVALAGIAVLGLVLITRRGKRKSGA